MKILLSRNAKMKMKIYGGKQNSRRNRVGRGKNQLRNLNILFGAMLYVKWCSRNGVDLKSKSQVKKLVYVNRSSTVLPIGTRADTSCYGWKIHRTGNRDKCGRKRETEIRNARKIVINVWTWKWNASFGRFLKYATMLLEIISLNLSSFSEKIGDKYFCE